MKGNTAYYMQMFIPLILLFFCMWFFLIRPQRRKDNEARKMRNNLQPGDEIVTIGGIVGKVLNVKDDSIVIYCGSDKTKMEFKKWAVSEVVNKSDRFEKEDMTESFEEAEPQKRKIKKLTKKEDPDLGN